MQAKVLIMVLLAVSIVSYLSVQKITMNGGAVKNGNVRNGWHCIPGSSVPIKWINGKLACLSNDGKHCVYNVCRKGKFNPSFKIPLKHIKCQPTPPWCTRVKSLLKTREFEIMKKKNRLDAIKAGLNNQLNLKLKL